MSNTAAYAVKDINCLLISEIIYSVERKQLQSLPLSYQVDRRNALKLTIKIILAALKAQKRLRQCLKISIFLEIKHFSEKKKVNELTNQFARQEGTASFFC